MIRLAERSVGRVYCTYLALRYDLMGIIPRRGFPYDCFLLYALGWPLMPSATRNYLLACSTILFSLTLGRLWSPKLLLLSHPLSSVLPLQFREAIPRPVPL